MLSDLTVACKFRLYHYPIHWIFGVQSLRGHPAVLRGTSLLVVCIFVLLLLTRVNSDKEYLIIPLREQTFEHIAKFTLVVTNETPQ